MTVIFSDDLARALEVSEDDIFEMARTMKLPFAISTVAPRRLFISAAELPMWRGAVHRIAAMRAWQGGNAAFSARSNIQT
jgi:hypothetical protein